MSTSGYDMAVLSHAMAADDRTIYRALQSLDISPPKASRNPDMNASWTAAGHLAVPTPDIRLWSG